VPLETSPPRRRLKTKQKTPIQIKKKLKVSAVLGTILTSLVCVASEVEFKTNWD
jgi:hypothetical protein